MRNKSFILGAMLLIFALSPNLVFADDIFDYGASTPTISYTSNPNPFPVGRWHNFTPYNYQRPYCPYNYGPQQVFNTTPNNTTTTTNSDGSRKITTTTYPGWGNYGYNPYWGGRRYYPPYYNNYNNTSNSVGGNILRSLIGLN